MNLPKANAEWLVLATMAPAVAATRVMDVLLTAASPSPGSQRELNLMVSEKAEAFVESMFAVNLALMNATMQGMVAASRPVTAVNLYRAMDDVIAASLKPYSRKVRANRRRLAKN